MAKLRAAMGRFCSARLKIWGEIIEHEEGYRSEFGKIVSLDYGDPELLDKFRRIYGVSQASENAVINISSRRLRPSL